MEAIYFVPLMLSTLALVLVSFLAKKKDKLKWIILAFVIWLLSFLFTILWGLK